MKDVQLQNALRSALAELKKEAASIEKRADELLGAVHNAETLWEKGNRMRWLGATTIGELAGTHADLIGCIDFLQGCIDKTNNSKTREEIVDAVLAQVKQMFSLIISMADSDDIASRIRISASKESAGILMSMLHRHLKLSGHPFLTMIRIS